MYTVEVCYSPLLFPLYANKENIVVVIDILRATSVICTAFEHGLERVIPVSSIEEAQKYKQKEYLVAAERSGKIVDGFEWDNSPFTYMNGTVKGKTLVLTTTNGTQAINAASPHSYAIAIGSFLNLDALCNWLIKQQRNVILLCAGWKDKFNMEDSLFAGAVTENLIKNKEFSSNCDSALVAMQLYNIGKKDLLAFLKDSSHYKRLARLNLEKDIAYCLTPNQTTVIPVLQGEALVKYEAMLV